MGGEHWAEETAGAQAWGQENAWQVWGTEGLAGVQWMGEWTKWHWRREGEPGHRREFVFYSNCSERSMQGFCRATAWSTWLFWMITLVAVWKVGGRVRDEGSMPGERVFLLHNFPGGSTWWPTPSPDISLVRWSALAARDPWQVTILGTGRQREQWFVNGFWVADPVSAPGVICVILKTILPRSGAHFYWARL